MREFLFRGKTYSNKWVYGYLVKGSIDEDFYILKNVGGTPFWIDQETIGQYTGLTDKNGKKIFEGDIVKFHTETYTSESDTIGKIEYFNGTFGISYKNGKHFLEFINMSMYVRWYEVIGNIHDNPELLEKDNV